LARLRQPESGLVLPPCFGFHLFHGQATTIDAVLANAMTIKRTDTVEVLAAASALATLAGQFHAAS
jgi:hypothetical protein